jgi:RHS repeat-associated protein
MTSATYDGNGLRASETTAAGTQDFTWDDANDLLMDSDNAYIYAGSAAPAEQVNLATGAVTYLNQDVLGSVRGIVSASGNLVATTSYDAWGNPQSPGGLTSYTPFGYSGGYTDPTGLIYLLNRYYDPSTGAFLSVDPDLSETGALQLCRWRPGQLHRPGRSMAGRHSKLIARLDLRSRFRELGERHLAREAAISDIQPAE